MSKKKKKSRKLAESEIPGRAESSAPSMARSGTILEPYVRRDGVKTRTTSFCLPVDIAQWLRVHAAQTGQKQSAIVAQALRELQEKSGL